MKKKKGNKTSHITKEERFCIKKLLDSNKGYREIGRILNRGKTTISDEVKNNGGKENYYPDKAHVRAYLKQYRKKRNCNKVAMDRDLQKFVEKRLNKGWSPETISNRLVAQSGVKYTSNKSIRKYIDNRPSLERNLFWNRVNKKSGPKRRKGTYLDDKERKSIEKREDKYGLLLNLEYGHWEGDFIVSKSNSFVLLVLVERYTKYVLVEILPNRKNKLTNDKIYSMLKNYKVKSLTLDNDIAFQNWRGLERRLSCNIYFTHPYRSWEKGLVENMNRWIRVFIPKKTDIGLIYIKDLKSIQNYLNHTPRQCLDGFSSYEVMSKKKDKKTVVSPLIDLPKVLLKIK